MAAQRRVSQASIVIRLMAARWQSITYCRPCSELARRTERRFETTSGVKLASETTYLARAAPIARRLRDWPQWYNVTPRREEPADDTR